MRVLGGTRLGAVACIAAGEVTLSYPSEMLSARGRACLERKNKPPLGCAQSGRYPEGLSAAVSAAGTGGRRLVSRGQRKVWVCQAEQADVEPALPWLPEPISPVMQSACWPGGTHRAPAASHGTLQSGSRSPPFQAGDGCCL